MTGGHWIRTAALVSCLLLPIGLTAQAQNLRGELTASAILTIDWDNVFARSKFGQRSLAEYEAKAETLTQENAQIEADLNAEEQELAAQREAMDPAAFRKLADAFDQKVQTIRRTQLAKATELNAFLEQRRSSFITAIYPVLDELMRETGAVVILDRNEVVYSADITDITDLALTRIDAALIGPTPAVPSNE